VVTGDELLELRVHEEKRFLVAVELVHSLENIVKITFKKRTPKLLTFLYSPESRDGASTSAGADAPAAGADLNGQVPPAGASAEAGSRSSDGKGRSGAGGQEQLQPDQQQITSAQYVVERPTECIATVTRAVDAFVTKQAAASAAASS
jgi:hypothetical protein